MPIFLKILLTSMLMTAIAVAIGLHGLYGEQRLGALAIQMYDGSFMSVNLIRSAETRFQSLRGLYASTYAARRDSLTEPSERTRLLAIARGKAAASAQPHAAIDKDAAGKAFGDILDDLDVAIERATSESARLAARSLRGAIEAIGKQADDAPGTMARLDQAAPTFEQAAELFAQDGYEARSQAEALMAASVRSTWIAIASSIAAALAITMVLTAIVVPDLRRAARAAMSIAAGNLDNLFPRRPKRSRSETAIVLGALSRMQAALREKAAHIEAMHLAEVQQRDAADATRREALLNMASKVEIETDAAVSLFASQTSVMSEAAAAMAALADQTGSNAQAAAAAGEQTSACMRMVAISADQLSGSIAEINAQVGRSTSVAHRAIDAGQSARSSIDTLSERVGRIGRVVGIISEIAHKTNLLALNATIESARAGDAGKGFAVVAHEVKALATQTAQSTKEITAHIAEVRSATEAAVASMARIEATVAEIQAVAAQTAGAIESQGQATQEITRNVVETSRATAELARLIAEVSRISDATRDRSGSVSQDAKALSDAASGLQRRVVQVIRSSTGDVDRRRSHRYPLDYAGTLRLAGGPDIAIKVADLSQGGARICNAPDVTAGTTGTLTLVGVDVPLPFEVLAVQRLPDGHTLHVCFMLNDAQRQAFAGVPERLAAEYDRSAKAA